MENNKKKEQPAQKLSIKMDNRDYELDFFKITNAQLIDIESAKIRMTGGANKEMVYGGPSAQQAYLINEAIATFENVIPDLHGHMNVKSLLDLNQVQTKSILKEYKKYYEWMNLWREYLNEDVEQ